jgi:hypothetical protein
MVLFARSASIASCLALVACSSGGDNDGTGGSAGAGGSDGNVPISFSSENALATASANATTIGVAADLGTLLGAAFGSIAEAEIAVAAGISTKQASLQVQCPVAGTITLLYGRLLPAEAVTLEFNDCAGSVFSAAALNGTLTFIVRAATDSLPGVTLPPGVVLPTEGTATVDLSAFNGATTITGMFQVTIPQFFPTVRIEFGSEVDSDLLLIERITEQGTETIAFVCFLIRMTVALAPPVIVDGSFEPRGLAVINGRDVFTLDTREPLSFTGGVATIGSTENTSGNARIEFSPFCSGIGAPGDGSFVAVEFSGDECVEVSGLDTDREPFQFSTTWSRLLNADTTPDPAACQPAPSCSVGAGAGGVGCPDDLSGGPAITGQPTVSDTTVALGDGLTFCAPVNAATKFVRAVVTNTDTLDAIAADARATTNGAETVELQAPITGSTVGDFFVIFYLCESEAECFLPAATLSPTTYQRGGNMEPEYFIVVQENGQVVGTEFSTCANVVEVEIVQ